MRGRHPQRPSRHPGSRGHSPAHAPAQCVCSQDRPCGSENLGRPVGKARLRPRGGGIRAREATGAKKQPDADAAPRPPARGPAGAAPCPGAPDGHGQRQAALHAAGGPPRLDGRARSAPQLRGRVIFRAGVGETQASKLGSGLSCWIDPVSEARAWGRSPEVGDEGAVASVAPAGPPPQPLSRGWGQPGRREGPTCVFCVGICKARASALWSKFSSRASRAPCTPLPCRCAA